MSSGGKGAKAPKAPDYAALAEQQGKINKETAQYLTEANRANQVDAFGNTITWNQEADPRVAAHQQSIRDAQNMVVGQVYPGTDGLPLTEAGKQKYIAAAQKAAADYGAGNGKWTQTQTMSPEIKAYWDKYLADSSKASSRYGDVLNEFLGGYQTPDDFTYQALKAYSDPEFNGTDVANALYGSIMDRGRVEQQRESDALDTKLRLQGLVPGSEAYNRAMQNLMTSQNDANLLASQQATLAGANEGRQKYASYLSGQNQGYNQALGTYTTNRNQPLQELAGMAGIASGQPYTPSFPNYSAATGYQPTDLVGAANAQYNASANKANASNSKKGSMLGAGASLGGAFLGGK